MNHNLRLLGARAELAIGEGEVTTAEQSYVRFSEFLELIPDATVAVDPSGEIVLANQQASEVFGYARDELVGLNVDQLVPERFRAGHPSERASYFEDPRTRPMGADIELYGLRADGSEFPAEISLSATNMPEGLVAIAAVRDITDRVGAEAERARLETELKLTQSQRLESIGQLAGGIAHDFNNLLGVIINYAEFAAAELADKPEVRDDVEQIQSAAHRAASLTRQLLIFSRREIVKPQPINLNDTLEDLEKLLRRVIGEHVNLVTGFEPGLWTVVADPGQIEQVAINLAVNARDAMPNGGTLQIDTANVLLDAEYARSHPDSPEPGRYVRLTVADSGHGMDQATIDRAFEPFFTTKPKPQGTGLGLATVYGIVRNHGGNIFLYSEKGQGTSVKIHLPATLDGVARDDDTEAARRDRGEEKQVLVVEDEQSVRRMVVRALSSNGYRVADFARAADALEYLRANRDENFALLLTDVIMPEMQGSELAAEVEKFRPDIPVLFMSGYSELMMDRLDPTSAEVNLIEKPFTVNDLLGEVQRLIEEGGS